MLLILPRFNQESQEVSLKASQEVVDSNEVNHKEDNYNYQY